MRYRENGTAGRPRRSAPDAADRKPRDGTCSCCRGFFGMSATASGTPKQVHPRSFSRRPHRGDRGPCPTSPSLKLRSVADDRRCTKAEPVCWLTSESSWCENLDLCTADAPQVIESASIPGAASDNLLYLTQTEGRSEPVVAGGIGSGSGIRVVWRSGDGRPPQGAPRRPAARTRPCRLGAGPSLHPSWPAQPSSNSPLVPVQPPGVSPLNALEFSARL